MEINEVDKAAVVLHERAREAESDSAAQEFGVEEELEIEFLRYNPSENDADFPESGPHSAAARFSGQEAIEEMTGRKFTMAEFHEAWRIVKQDGPFPFPFVFHCEDGISRWLLPPGNAEGCESDGPTSKAISLLYSGVGTFFKPVVPYSPRRLFEQEEYVYRMEMRSEVTKAIEQLSRVNPLPHCPGHAASDTVQFPENVVPMPEMAKPKRGGQRRKRAA